MHWFNASLLSAVWQAIQDWGCWHRTVEKHDVPEPTSNVVISTQQDLLCVCLAMAYFLIFIFKELLHRRKKLNYQYMHKMTCTVLAILLSPSKCLAYACLDRLWDAIWTGWGGNMVRITKKNEIIRALACRWNFFYCHRYVCMCRSVHSIVLSPPNPSSLTPVSVLVGSLVFLVGSNHCRVSKIIVLYFIPIKMPTSRFIFLECSRKKPNPYTVNIHIICCFKNVCVSKLSAK